MRGNNEHNQPQESTKDPMPSEPKEAKPAKLPSIHDEFKKQEPADLKLQICQFCENCHCHHCYCHDNTPDWTYDGGKLANKVREATALSDHQDITANQCLECGYTGYFHVCPKCGGEELNEIIEAHFKKCEFCRYAYGRQ